MQIVIKSEAVFFYFRNEIAYFLFIRFFVYNSCSFLATQPSETLTLKRGIMWKGRQFPMNLNDRVRKLVSKWLPNRGIAKCSFSANSWVKIHKLNNSCLLASFYQKAEYTTRLTTKNKTQENREKLYNWACKEFQQWFINIKWYFEKSTMPWSHCRWKLYVVQYKKEIGKWLGCFVFFFLILVISSTIKCFAWFLSETSMTFTRDWMKTL